jgi:hypothetical protein
MKLPLIFVFLLCILSVFPASINVDELNIIADGYFLTTNNTKFQMNTYFKFVTSFDGGFKFAAKVAFETTTKQLEQNFITNVYGLGNVYLFFHDAEVTARNLADSHLSISFWTGTHKYLGSGNRYRGFLYYPASNDVDYQGFYRQRGTGLTTEIKFWEDRFRAGLDIYQNTNFISLDPMALNVFSVDMEAGLYFKYGYVELFGGYTKDLVYPYTDATTDMINGRGKVGASFWIGNEYLDFLATFGVPKMDSNIAATNFNSFFILSELHFKLFIADNTISFLTHPAYYNELSKEKRADPFDFDLSVKMHLSSPDFPLSGGTLFNFKWQLSNMYNCSLVVSPYLSISMSGVLWTFNIHYDFWQIYWQKYLDGLRIVIGVSSKF